MSPVPHQENDVPAVWPTINQGTKPISLRLPSPPVTITRSEQIGNFDALVLHSNTRYNQLHDYFGRSMVDTIRKPSTVDAVETIERLKEKYQVKSCPPLQEEYWQERSESLKTYGDADFVEKYMAVLREFIASPDGHFLTVHPKTGAPLSSRYRQFWVAHRFLMAARHYLKDKHLIKLAEIRVPGVPTPVSGSTTTPAARKTPSSTIRVARPSSAGVHRSNNNDRSDRSLSEDEEDRQLVASIRRKRHLLQMGNRRSVDSSGEEDDASEGDDDERVQISGAHREKRRMLTREPGSKKHLIVLDSEDENGVDMIKKEIRSATPPRSERQHRSTNFGTTRLSSLNSSSLSTNKTLPGSIISFTVYWSNHERYSNSERNIGALSSEIVPFTFQSFCDWIESSFRLRELGAALVLPLCVHMDAPMGLSEIFAVNNAVLNELKWDWFVREASKPSRTVCVTFEAASRSNS